MIFLEFIFSLGGKMRRIAFLLVILAAMPGSVLSGELYRWEDEKGNIHYGDTPQGEAEKLLFRNPSAEDLAQGSLPLEMRSAQKNFPVTLYVAENCKDYCEQARGVLNKRGIPFAEKVLKTQEDIQAFKAISPAGSVPTISVGKTFLEGFQAERWNNELDFAGYPKTAPYRPTAPHPVSAPSATEQPGTFYPNIQRHDLGQP
jgi:glutaredoxin